MLICSIVFLFKPPLSLKLKTLLAALTIFIQAYNDFAVAKMKFRQNCSLNLHELLFYP